jgi:acetylornithine deacetylase/succinyl-diaminopimelate desuccinylase-like protein
MNKLGEYGATDVSMDPCGNVVYFYPAAKSGKAILFNAHIDTVFDRLDKIEPEIREGRMYAPSAGDNSANVAALLLAVKLRVW